VERADVASAALRIVVAATSAGLATAVTLLVAVPGAPDDVHQK